MNIQALVLCIHAIIILNKQPQQMQQEAFSTKECLIGQPSLYNQYFTAVKRPPAFPVSCLSKAVNELQISFDIDVKELKTFDLFTFVNTLSGPFSRCCMRFVFFSRLYSSSLNFVMIMLAFTILYMDLTDTKLKLFLNESRHGMCHVSYQIIFSNFFGFVKNFLTLCINVLYGSLG